MTVDGKRKWDDTEDIAIRLTELHPDVKPLTVRFTDLHRWVTELDDFDDAPDAANEGILESIQMAWWDEYKAEYPDADPYGGTLAGDLDG